MLDEKLKELKWSRVADVFFSSKILLRFWLILNENFLNLNDPLYRGKITIFEGSRFGPKVITILLMFSRFEERKYERSQGER